MVSRFLILLLALTTLSDVAAADPVREKLGIDASIGWSLFKRPWISAPSSLQNGGGLGPLFDARSCNACHSGGGAGRIAEDAIGGGMAVRVGRSDGSPDPVYGTQIQTQALPGFDPEADLAFHWDAMNGLRAPKLAIAQFHYGLLAADSHAAMRRAPSLIGLGKLESIPEAEIVAQTGSGHPSWIVDADGKRKLGRFGYKATLPDLPSQIAFAFHRDFGIGTTRFPGAFGECTETEKACRAAGGPDVEVPDNFPELIATYIRTFPAPLPRNEKSNGFALFRKAGCLQCHAVLKDAKGQEVQAYTDLLLHDLGSALDDGVAEGSVKSAEWRTAPLWSVPEELAQGGLLHDGRARSIDEAVAWHGGEASGARTAFNALSPKDRKILDDFLLGH
jgi:CxxC motif-containing protein (DUF1111 family)